MGSTKKAKGLPLGIDIGGSGIKGAPVDLASGELARDRLKIATPTPSTPGAVAGVIAEIVEHFADDVQDGPIGITIPGVVMHGVVRTAANIDKSWIGVDMEALLEGRLGRDVTVVNDADAAGVAEIQFGAARGERGLVILTTLGTGIGSAIIHRGELVPNSELGHVIVDGYDAETRAASSVKEREGLSYETWATERLTPYYRYIESVLWPDLFVVGGGVSRKSERFLPLVDCRTPLVPAALRNEAGIIGAAWLAATHSKRKRKARKRSRPTPGSRG